MFLRGVANTLDLITRVRQSAAVGQIDYKTSGCLDGLVINGNAITGCGRASYDALQLSAPGASVRASRAACSISSRATKARRRASNEAATTQNTFDYETDTARTRKISRTPSTDR